MARITENLFQRGPVIRDLAVPEEELLLQPARLRARRRKVLGPLLRRWYGAVLLAWTLGLIAATTDLLQAGRASSSSPERRTSGEVPVLSVPDLPPPLRIDPPPTADARP